MFLTCRLTCSVICLSRSSNNDAEEILAVEAAVVGTDFAAEFTISFSTC